MEYILYVLMLVSLNDNGSVSIFKPVLYSMEVMCEFNKKLALNSVKPTDTISYDATCVKIVLSNRSI